MQVYVQLPESMTAPSPRSTPKIATSGVNNYDFALWQGFVTGIVLEVLVRLWVRLRLGWRSHFTDHKHTLTLTLS